MGNFQSRKQRLHFHLNPVSPSTTTTTTPNDILPVCHSSLISSLSRPPLQANPPFRLQQPPKCRPRLRPRSSARASGRSLTTPRRPRSGMPLRMRTRPARYVLQIFETFGVGVGGWIHKEATSPMDLDLDSADTAHRGQRSDHDQAKIKRHGAPKVTHETTSKTCD